MGFNSKFIKMATPVVAVGLLAAGTVASPSDVLTSSRGFDSCSVVTKAEAASALGQRVSAGALGSATVEGGLACVFYGPSAPTPRTPNVAQGDSVRVVVVKGPDAAKWYNEYKAKVPAKAVTGFGTHAFYDGYASLSVLKGPYYLRIAVSPPNVAPSLIDEEKLARAVLPKL